MANAKKALAVLKWMGDEPILARVVGGGVKEVFNKGTVKLAEHGRASQLASFHKQFSVIDLTDLSPEELKMISDGNEEALAERVKVQKQLEKEAAKAKKDDAKREKEAQEKAQKESEQEIVDEVVLDVEVEADLPASGK